MIKISSQVVRPSISYVGFNSARRNQAGMTVLEVMIASLMLVVFTGVVAMVMEFTFRFLGASEAGELDENNVANGVLIDHQEIQLSMDLLIDMLSQPGISKDRLDGKVMGEPRIAFNPAKSNPSVACAANPVRNWGLPMRGIKLPPGYKLCLWSTTAVEPSLTDLLDAENPDNPGIYLLQALPEKLSASTLPTRRLFCRPRPFC